MFATICLAALSLAITETDAGAYNAVFLVEISVRTAMEWPKYATFLDYYNHHLTNYIKPWIEAKENIHHFPGQFPSKSDPVDQLNVTAIGYMEQSSPFRQTNQFQHEYDDYRFYLRRHFPEREIRGQSFLHRGIKAAAKILGPCTNKNETQVIIVVYSGADDASEEATEASRRFLEGRNGSCSREIEVVLIPGPEAVDVQSIPVKPSICPAAIVRPSFHLDNHDLFISFGHHGGFHDSMRYLLGLPGTHSQCLRGTPSPAAPECPITTETPRDYKFLKGVIELRDRLAKSSEQYIDEMKKIDRELRAIANEELPNYRKYM